MGTIKMPSSEDIDKAYIDAIARVPDRYKKAVSRVTGFKEAAIAGQGNYVRKMSEPDVLARRAEKLAEMPEGEWKKAAEEKGARNIGPGMRDGAPKRKRNYEVIRNALNGLEIGERSTDWEVNVDTRLKNTIKAMKAAAGKK